MCESLPLLHPRPDALLHGQLDGNLSLSSSNNSTIDRTPEPNNADQVNPPLFTPQLHSTPTHVHDIQNNPDSSPVPPGLFDTLSSIPSSVSLESWSDLDEFLPFARTPESQPNHSNLPPDTELSDLLDPTLNDSFSMNANPIPVIIGHVPTHSTQPNSPAAPRHPYRTTVKRDNRAVTALSLPNIMVTNHRSIFPKFKNLVDEIFENDMHL